MFLVEIFVFTEVTNYCVPTWLDELRKQPQQPLVFCSVCCVCCLRGEECCFHRNKRRANKWKFSSQIELVCGGFKEYSYGLRYGYRLYWIVRVVDYSYRFHYLRNKQQPSSPSESTQKSKGSNSYGASYNRIVSHRIASTFTVNSILSIHFDYCLTHL